jgi:RsiW-degrading membrane proteinase PrsW (M82 family)
MEIATKLLIALLPVLAFLGALIFMDSFKLVRPRGVAVAIIAGVGAAMLALGASFATVALFPISQDNLARYVAPVYEEILKALFLVFLLRTHRVGFMVDGAIQGFSIGTGFAIIENLFYMQQMPERHVLVWIVRGFGTAIMHGGTTAIVSVMAKSLLDRRQRWSWALLLPGLLVAIVVHSLYNHFPVRPEIATVLTLLLLSALMWVVFQRSEAATRGWLGIGFDSDRELFEMIAAGTLAETRIGRHLASLEVHFPSAVVADMLCYLRLHVELSIRAKGILLMKEAGFKIDPDPEVREKFAELRYLENAIGATGKLALRPFLHRSSRDLWQMHMLDSQ